MSEHLAEEAIHRNTAAVLVLAHTIERYRLDKAFGGTYAESEEDAGANTADRYRDALDDVMEADDG